MSDDFYFDPSEQQDLSFGTPIGDEKQPLLPPRQAVDGEIPIVEDEYPAADEQYAIQDGEEFPLAAEAEFLDGNEEDLMDQDDALFANKAEEDLQDKEEDPDSQNGEYPEDGASDQEGDEIPAGEEEDPNCEECEDEKEKDRGLLNEWRGCIAQLLNLAYGDDEENVRARLQNIVDEMTLKAKYNCDIQILYHKPGYVYRREDYPVVDRAREGEGADAKYRCLKVGYRFLDENGSVCKELVDLCPSATPEFAQMTENDVKTPKTDIKTSEFVMKPSQEEEQTQEGEQVEKGVLQQGIDPLDESELGAEALEEKQNGEAKDISAADIAQDSEYEGASILCAADVTEDGTRVVFSESGFERLGKYILDPHDYRVQFDSDGYILGEMREADDGLKFAFLIEGKWLKLHTQRADENGGTEKLNYVLAKL